MQKILKKISNLVYYYNNKVLNEVFGRMKPVKDMNAESYAYTKKHTSKSYKASEWHRKQFGTGSMKNMAASGGKTLYILGSGPSINEITDKEWEIIGKNESWAFNLFSVHDFVPSVYFAQASPSAPHNNVMQAGLQRHREAYQKVKFVLRGHLFNDHEFHKTALGEYILNNFPKEHILPLSEYVIRSTCSIEPGTYLGLLEERGLLDMNKSEYPVPKFGTTLGLLLSLAVKLGYKDIVLCGIDMQDNDHFFHDKKYALAGGADMEKVIAYHDKKINGNINSGVRAYTDVDYILAFRKYLRGRSGGNIYLAKKSSILYPELEIHPDFAR